jgi:Holliday junction resolvasome RuvABC endonuclease subunit
LAETIIALDLATKCGFAVLRGRKRLESGRWNLMAKPRGVLNHRGRRWWNLDFYLSNLLQKYHPDVLAYESVRRHVGTTAAHVYGGLVAVLELMDFEEARHGETCESPACLSRPPEMLPVEISTWKKATVGKGNALKPDVQRFVKRRFRYTAPNDDEADAIAIAEAVRRMRQGEYP